MNEYASIIDIAAQVGKTSKEVLGEALQKGVEIFAYIPNCDRENWTATGATVMPERSFNGIPVRTYGEQDTPIYEKTSLFSKVKDRTLPLDNEAIRRLYGTGQYTFTTLPMVREDGTTDVFFVHSDTPPHKECNLDLTLDSLRLRTTDAELSFNLEGGKQDNTTDRPAEVRLTGAELAELLDPEKRPSFDSLRRWHIHPNYPLPHRVEGHDKYYVKELVLAWYKQHKDRRKKNHVKSIRGNVTK